VVEEEKSSAPVVLDQSPAEDAAAEPTEKAAEKPAALPTPPAPPAPPPAAGKPPVAKEPAKAPVAKEPVKTPEKASEKTAEKVPATDTAPAAKTDGSAALSIVFKATETALPLTTKDQMDALLTKLKADESLHVNLIAYASAAPDQSNTARRVSLSRALSVRAYLIDNGVGSLRINVQAEGDKNPGGEADRVDIFVTK
jgi:outer membrane protein OmpA-like peptidoglycan-associated protein